MSAHIIPTVPRTLRHLDTDQRWAERDTVSKVHCTAVEAAHRLRGLADLLYGIGLDSDPQREKMSFLGSSVKDIALALERVTEAQWAEWEAEDQKPTKRRKGRAAR